MKNLCSTLVALILIGCDQIEIHKPKTTDNQNSGEAKIQSIDSSSLEELIKVNVKGTDPEKYAVQFSWPYLENNKILRIRLGSVLAEVLPNQTFFTHVLSHNQTVTFSFDILDKNRKLEKTFSKTVVLPTDFVARADSALINSDKKIEVNRIYLSDEFPLTTNGKNVDIVTNEIHADHGFIQTFPEKIKFINKEVDTNTEMPPTAEPEKNGHSGGNVSISAKKLFGKLKVYMRGENGGQGQKGDAISSPKIGFGTPATVGRNICEHDSNGGIGQCACEYGAPGGPGIPGDKGNTGKKGMTGGDSGNVRISIHEYVPLEGIDPTLPKDSDEVVQVFQVPGAGGRGGPGGDGQKGSPGGPGRDPNNYEDCRGEKGADGPQGKNGDEGPTGDSGKKGLKCIYIGSENVNECTQ